MNPAVDSDNTRAAIALNIAAGFMLGLALGVVMALGKTPGITVAVLGILGGLITAGGIGTSRGLQILGGLAGGVVVGLGGGLYLREVVPIRVVFGTPAPAADLASPRPRPDFGLHAGTTNPAADLGEAVRSQLDGLTDPKDADLKADLERVGAFARYYDSAPGSMKALSDQLASRPELAPLKQKLDEFRAATRAQ